MLLHHELTVQVGAFSNNKKVQTHMPARKIVRCSTRELHQSLLVKLGSCQLVKTGSKAEAVVVPQPQQAHFVATDMAVHMVSL